MSAETHSSSPFPFYLLVGFSGTLSKPTPQPPFLRPHLHPSPNPSSNLNFSFKFQFQLQFQFRYRFRFRFSIQHHHPRRPLRLRLVPHLLRGPPPERAMCPSLVQPRGPPSLRPRPRTGGVPWAPPQFRVLLLPALQDAHGPPLSDALPAAPATAGGPGGDNRGG